MRRITFLFSMLVLGTAAQAQTVATFDDLTLHGSDTEYVNYSMPGTNVGFNDGLAHFPCYYDTASYGNSLGSGFVYSNRTDSATTPGFGADSVFYLNPNKEFIAKTGIGYAGSANYAVAFVSNPVTYKNNINLNLNSTAVGKPVFGFYATNTCYAYSSMKYGDNFDTAFHHGDWFLLTVKGYHSGALTPDSVNFYLADYRFTDSSMNYILNKWQWVNLLPLGKVDSLQFSLSASDTSGGYMNVPAYFCMDNFTTNETDESVNQPATAAIAKVYPNPATHTLYVDVTDNSVSLISVMDMAGNVVDTYPVSSGHIAINTASLPAGTYLLQLSGNGRSGVMRFVKE